MAKFIKIDDAFINIKLIDSFNLQENRGVTMFEVNFSEVVCCSKNHLIEGENALSKHIDFLDFLTDRSEIIFDLYK